MQGIFPLTTRYYQVQMILLHRNEHAPSKYDITKKKLEIIRN